MSTRGSTVDAEKMAEVLCTSRLHPYPRPCDKCRTDVALALLNV